jgi:hypothetical protein
MAVALAWTTSCCVLAVAQLELTFLDFGFSAICCFKRFIVAIRLGMSLSSSLP